MKMELVYANFNKRHFRIINPEGRVAVITLWSDVDWVMRQFEGEGIDLSDVCVVANLYGNGIPKMLCNLLNNPQIERVVVVGRDKSNSLEELKNYFIYGLEDAKFFGQNVRKIVDSDRIVNGVESELFLGREVEIVDVTNNGEFPYIDFDVLRKKIILGSDHETRELKRIHHELPEVSIKQYPADTKNINIVCDSPFKAWEELVTRAYRFGQVVELKKGERRELHNVRVVVEGKSKFDNIYRFDPEKIKKYCDDFLDGELPKDTKYTYGNRMMQYYGFDLIDCVIRKLIKDPESRYCCINLWDNKNDLLEDKAHPCFVNAFLRKFNGKLCLTAIFRTHNIMNGWVNNYFGLQSLLEYICESTGLEYGSVTIVSESISISPDGYEEAKIISENWQHKIKEDPHGNCHINIEGDEIVVVFCKNGQQIREFRGKKAEVLCHKIANDMAVSDVGHAMYIGRELQKAQERIGI